MRVFETDDAECKAGAPGDHEKTGERGQRAGSPAQLGADTDRDADDIRSRQELRQANNVEKFVLIKPAAPLDRDPARPDDAAAEPEQGNGEKSRGERGKRHARGYTRIIRDRRHDDSTGIVNRTESQ
jgi:hypothetical protein